MPLAEDSTTPHRFTIGQCATLACLLEATAAKPGNVHRGADFVDLTFGDLAVSGVVIALHMERASAGQPLGNVILQAVTDTQKVVATNSNLGMILLIAPLAAVNRNESLTVGLPKVLAQLTAADAAQVYEAIRLARPGGLGNVDEEDVAGAAPPDLVSAMRLAADRDAVARQYATNFADVLEFVVPTLQQEKARNASLVDSIVLSFLRTLAKWPDSLIARKCGAAMASEVSDRAAEVLAAYAAGPSTFLMALADLDFFLRMDGHRRNPGTTADLLAAGLFAALRDGIICPPWRLTSDWVGEE